MCIICTIREAAAQQARPWPADPINHGAPGWLMMVDKYQEFLDSLNIKSIIDEVALLFRERGDKGNFVVDAIKGEGVKAFNASEDIVKTKPFETTYGVEYVFLEAECLNGMRVELMDKIGGTSPLHDALIQNHLQGVHHPVVVHLSFKCRTADEYYDAIYALDNNEQASLVQSCDSEYGIFSYYNVPLLGPCYLKPRLNMREIREKEEAQKEERLDDLRDAVKEEQGTIKPGEVHEMKRPIKDNPQA